MAAVASPVGSAHAHTHAHLHAFVAACSALSSHATTTDTLRVAEQHLEELRSSPAGISLAKDVLCAPDGAVCAATHIQQQAALLLRDATLRHWVLLSTTERLSLRDWSLAVAIERARLGASQLASQLAIVHAIVWKRSWADAELLAALAPGLGIAPGDATAMSRALGAALVGEMRALLTSGERGLVCLGVCVCVCVIQEFDARSGSKATALGVSSEFHFTCAAQFQTEVLPQLCAIAAAQLRNLTHTHTHTHTHGLSHGGGAADSAGRLDVELIVGFLCVVSECLSWQFGSGSSASSASATTPRRTHTHTHTRSGAGAAVNVSVSPGRAWRNVLAAEVHEFTAVVLALYSALRQSPLLSARSPSGARVIAVDAAMDVLTLLAALNGEIFTDVGARVTHARALLAAAPAVLSVSVEDAAAAFVASHASSAPIRSEDAVARSRQEHDDFMTLVQLVLHNTSVLQIVSALPSAASELQTEFGAVHQHVVATLQPIIHVATQLEAAWLSGNRVAAQTAARGFVDSEYGARIDSIGFALDAWLIAVRQLDSLQDAQARGSYAAAVEPETNGAAANALPARLDPAVLPIMLALLESFTQQSASIFEAVLQTRVLIGASIVRAEVDDDDEHEDASVLAQHLGSVAAIGRFCAPKVVPVLQRITAETCQRLHAAAASVGVAPRQDMPATIAAHSEELWWILSFSGEVLADSWRGEACAIPKHLNSLSKASLRALKAQMGALVPKAVQLSNDPVIALCTTTLQCVRMEVARSQQPSSVGTVSPLLIARFLWWISRWSRTYLLPDMTQFRDAALSPTFSAVYGPQLMDDMLAAAPDASVSSIGTLVILCPVGVESARQLLELCLEVVLTCLSTWDTEAGIVNECMEVLAGFCASKVCGRMLMLSPTWTRLASAASEAFSGAAAVSSAAAAILRLPVDVQGRLLQALLTPVRCIGFEHTDYDALDAELVRFDTVVAAHPAVATVVARWERYFSTLAAPIGARFQAILMNPTELAATADQPATMRNAELLLSLAGGIVLASPASRVPDTWHFPVTVAALQVCSSLVQVYRGVGVVCIRALQYMVRFLEVDVFSLDARQAVAVYSTVKAVFVAYASVHLGSQSSERAARMKQSRDARVAASGSNLEEEIYEDVLLLMSMLQHIITKEDLDFTTTPGLSDDAHEQIIHAASTDAVLSGLQLIIPVMSTGLLEYPRLRSAYVSVVSSLVSSHAARVAALDPGLFLTFMGSIELGLHSVDELVARECLHAVQVLLEYHVDCRKEGFTRMPGLLRQLQSAPTLLPQLTVAVLSMMLGGAPAPRALVSPAGKALCMIAIADLDAYRGTVARIVDSQPSDAARARLAAEFDALNSTLAVAGEPNRVVRNKFHVQFEVFVDAVQGFTRIK